MERKLRQVSLISDKIHSIVQNESHLPAPKPTESLAKIIALDKSKRFGQYYSYGSVTVSETP